MRVAAYARYSSDQQRDASLDDQLRNCRAYCARQGWPAPSVYSDAAMSGARNDRPGYLLMLSEASRFDVIVVDDLSRLSRDSVEAQLAVKRLRFAGVRVVGVSDGLDTGRKGHKAEVGLRGLMGELYLDDLRDKTHRGLSGRAIAGASAGGLPYGYLVTERGQRAIRGDHAQVVRRIFADYLAGLSARAIAVALNAEGVPSPRGSTWAVSAIYGDVKRGIGILANPIYAGRQVWNRSAWVKHPDSGRRIRRERPESEWIVTDHPELAIVDQRTWDAVQAALKRRGHAAGNKGRAPRSLLAGLLRCGECGGPITMIDAHSYGCSTAKNRGTCQNRQRVKARTADAAMVADVFYENVDDGAGGSMELQFRPRTGEPMLIACLWSHWTDPAGKEPELYSFAAITDDPEPEVAAAGHDRTVINIRPEHVDAWLDPNGDTAAMQAIFDDKRHPYYEHRKAA